MGPNALVHQMPVNLPIQWVVNKGIYPEPLSLSSTFQTGSKESHSCDKPNSFASQREHNHHQPKNCHTDEFNSKWPDGTGLLRELPRSHRPSTSLQMCKDDHGA